MRLNIAAVYCAPPPNYKLVVSARARMKLWISLELVINQANEMQTKAVVLLKKFYDCIPLALTITIEFIEAHDCSVHWKCERFKWKSCL